jgi:hypothetical protein
MIRNDPNTPAGRIGCAPGANCCSDCASHPPATLRGFLGQSGANYDPTDPTSDNYDPTAIAPAIAPASGPSKNILLYVGIGLAAVFLLESSSRRR